ncbi:MAG: tRNA (adenosine(37)-N6)-threonylcarbamoyltransferase complex ATPase subunit type 1 TsaE [Sphingobacteriaceae bacterium]
MLIDCIKLRSNLNSLPEISTQIVDFARMEPIWLFYGEMGAGKTTLIKSICLALGVTDLVSSPTFSIINDYQSKNGSVYHFDFYRLKNQDEALDMGYEEYFYSGNYCLVEWPEKISKLLPQTYIRIQIIVLDEQTREIIVDRHGF